VGVLPLRYDRASHPHSQRTAPTLTISFPPSHNPPKVKMGATVVKVNQWQDYAREVIRGAEVLSQGGIVVLPTETVYGATILLSNRLGRDQLKTLRKDGGSKPLTPHLVRPEQAELFLGPPSELAGRMMRKLWPGPVGLQFDVSPEQRVKAAANLAVGEEDLFDNGSITLRCPDHPVFTDVASKLDGPVAATLAGEAGSFDADKLARDLDGKVEMIFDAGPPRFSKPSTLVKVLSDGYQIVRAGVYDERTIARLMKTMILFVCSGNTCRSPMSEAIARKVLMDKFGVDAAGLEKRGIEVASAGAMAVNGNRATPAAVEAVKSLGADLSKHRSRPLTVELINQADVVYTMGRGHTRAVLSLVPSATEKVKSLDPARDIEDPIGGDVELYVSLAGVLKKLIEARLNEGPLP